MNDEDFDKIMDKWFNSELDSVQEIKPSEKVYRKVQTKQKKSFLFLLPKEVRWLMTGAAVAVIILTVFYRDIFSPSEVSNRLMPAVGLRTGYKIEKSEHKSEKIEPEKRGKKGETRDKKGAPVLKQLLFQYQNLKDPSIKSIDIIAPKEDRTGISERDNYRILIHPGREKWIYLFQEDSKNGIIRLFPNEDFCSFDNPFQADRIYFLPSTPDWFYVDYKKGEEVLYIVVSSRSLDDLDELYSMFLNQDNLKEKHDILIQLKNKFNSIEQQKSNNTTIYKFEFYIR